MMLTKREIDNIAFGLVDFLDELPPVPVTSYILFASRRNIAQICGAVFVGPNVTLRDMRTDGAGGRQNGKSTGYYLYARAASAMLIYTYSDLASFPSIGKMLGTDHSTIRHSVLPETQRKYFKNDVYLRGLVEADRRTLGLIAASWSWLKDRGKADAFLKAHKERIAAELRRTGNSLPHPSPSALLNEAHRLATGRDSPVLRLRDDVPGEELDLGAQGRGAEALAGGELQQAG